MQGILLLLIKFKFVISNLSVDYIQNVVDNVFQGEDEFLKETVANPIFGFLSHGLGLTNNIRFFSPALKPFFKDEQRIYIKDESDDPITSFIIKLYPSPAGFLQESTICMANPLLLFKKSIEESVLFYAKIFVLLIEKKEEFSFEFKKNENESKSAFERRKKVFNAIGNLILKKPSLKLFEDDVMVKLLLIHSYIIRALDPVKNYEDDYYFKIYLQEISKGLKNNEISNIRINKDLINSAVEFYNFINFFPFSEFNSPESNRGVQSYIRKTETFDEKTIFQDCAEVTLLQLCNSLFFKDGKYSIEHLSNASKELREFYEQFDEVLPLSDKIRMEWLKVVSDLPQPNVNNNQRYPTQNILYIRKNNNEIKSGIINLMNVLMKITGIDKQRIFKDINKENLFDRLELLIDELAIKENGKKIVQVTKGDLKEVKTKINNKFDFAGDFELQFNYSSGNEAEIKVEIFEKHSNLSLLLTKNADKSKTKFPIVHSNFDCLLLKIVNNYLTENRGETLKQSSLTFENLFIFGNLFFNDCKDKALLEISNQLDKLALTTKKEEKEENEDKKDKKDKKENEEMKLFENLGQRIVESIEFNDEWTRKSFYSYLFWCKELKITDFKELLEHKIRMESSANEYLKSKWINFFEDQKKNIIEIDEYDDDFYKNEQVQDFLINRIHEFPNLEEYLINFLYVDEKMLRTLLINLQKCTNLADLYLLKIKLDNIPIEINELTNLKTLYISAEKVNKVEFSIEKLINIYGLVLENIDFSSGFPEYFSKLKKLKKLIINSSKITKIPDFILENDQLELLILSDCSFDTVYSENFPKVENLGILNLVDLNLKTTPKFVKNLEHLDLSGNNLEGGLPKYFSKMENLEILKLSLTNTSKMPLFIKKLKKLEVLSLKSNNITFIPRSMKKVIFNLKTLNISENINFQTESSHTKIGKKELKEILGERLVC